ncbi:MAG TPA: FlgD immunoglobulin-like domain containing protein, partial [Candidatus Eisenbacteria bacterium]|nr:FlgD immunoglobulin-like domain containing protein [Candidatus Eisenbacteria bacterium]
GTFAYVAAYSLEVIDISNPSSPSLKGSVPGYGGAVAISGPYAFVAAGSSFVTVRSQCEIPTPVLLSYFEADPQPGAVLLEWATSFERDFSGFHVLRSLNRENRFERITSELIQAPYRFLDTRVNAGVIYDYTLEAVDRSGRTERMGLVSATPSSSVERLRPRLEEASPNPSTASATRIAFTLAERGPVALTILDVSGRRVRVLLSEQMESGERSVVWDGRDDQGTAVPAGVYLYDLKGPGFEATRRLVWLR